MAVALTEALLGIQDNFSTPQGIPELATDIIWLMFLLAVAPTSPLRPLLVPFWLVFYVLSATGVAAGPEALLGSLLFLGVAVARADYKNAVLVTVMTYVWFITTILQYGEASELPWQISLLTALLVAVNLPIWLSGRAYRRGQAVKEELEQTELRRALARIDERRHLATELHDGIARDLVVINLTARSMPSSHGEPLERLSADALDNLAHLVTVLRRGDAVIGGATAEAAPDISLDTAAARFAERLTHRGFHVCSSVEIPPDIVPPDAILSLVTRALDEATATVLSGASVGEVSLDILGGEERLIVDIAHTAGQSNVASVNAPETLQGLDERVQLLGGRLTTSVDDLTWQLMIDVPWTLPARVEP